MLCWQPPCFPTRPLFWEVRARFFQRAGTRRDGSFCWSLYHQMGRRGGARRSRPSHQLALAQTAGRSCTGWTSILERGCLSWAVWLTTSLVLTLSRGSLAAVSLMPAAYQAQSPPPSFSTRAPALNLCARWIAMSLATRSWEGPLHKLDCSPPYCCSQETMLSDCWVAVCGWPQAASPSSPRFHSPSWRRHQPPPTPRPFITLIRRLGSPPSFRFVPSMAKEWSRSCR
mmetsp:Transcript_29428/g.59262  ORF Transcript_29428/g.59262 Transcript_29428/m.59262 type:complete len:228 (-) Transcript_29428:1020-1703(-)